MLQQKGLGYQRVLCVENACKINQNAFLLQPHDASFHEFQISRVLSFFQYKNNDMYQMTFSLSRLFSCCSRVRSATLLPFLIFRWF